MRFSASARYSGSHRGTLREDVEVFVDEQKPLKFKDTTISTHETLDADHGRIETRNYTVIHDVGWLQARHQWPGLEAVVVVESQREINGKITNETRFYITSLVLFANAVGPMIRAHWPSKTPCTGSWTWSFATTNAALEPTTRRPISRSADTSPTISPARPRARIPSASAAKPPAGTTNISPSLVAA
jgi:hypothetical protein